MCRRCCRGSSTCSTGGPFCRSGSTYYGACHGSWDGGADRTHLRRNRRRLHRCRRREREAAAPMRMGCQFPVARRVDHGSNRVLYMP